MPNLPTQIVFPHYPRDWRDAKELQAWGEGFQKAAQRYLYNLTFTLNGIVKVGPLADRPATPLLDERFYYATDTVELYVASAGAWVLVV